MFLWHLHIDNSNGIDRSKIIVRWEAQINIQESGTYATCTIDLSLVGAVHCSLVLKFNQLIGAYCLKTLMASATLNQKEIFVEILL